MHNTSSTRLARAASIVLVAVVGLSACGSAEPSTSPEPPSSTETTSPLSSEPAATGAPTASGPGRTIEVVMTEFAYAPKDIAVKAGETVTFRFVNKGVLPHEILIVDEVMQVEHEAEMVAAAASSTSTPSTASAASASSTAPSGTWPAWITPSTWPHRRGIPGRRWCSWQSARRPL